MGMPANPKGTGGEISNVAREVVQHLLSLFPGVALQHLLIARVKQSGSLFLPTEGSQLHTDERNANSYHLLIILYVSPSAATHTSHILSHLILMLYLEVETMGISSSEVRKLRHREVKVRRLYIRDRVGISPLQCDSGFSTPILLHTILPFLLPDSSRNLWKDIHLYSFKLCICMCTYTVHAYFICIKLQIIYFLYLYYCCCLSKSPECPLP